MKPTTTSRVEAFWSRILGTPAELLFHGLTVSAHAGLGVYPGIFVVGRAGGCHISAPGHLLDSVVEATAQASVTDLLTSAWWQHTMGAHYQVRGPSIHHYLDHAGHLPPVDPSLAEMSALEGLRGAVSDSDWRESGFAEDADLVFVTTSGSGEVLAAANLTTFDDMLADVGVLTHPEHRGHGHGRTVAAAATAHSLAHNGLARWVARVDNAPSITLARRLGFAPWCHQLALLPSPRA